MEALTTRYLILFDNPLFQFVTGFLLGAILVGAIWLLRHMYIQEKMVKALTNALQESVQLPKEGEEEDERGKD